METAQYETVGRQLPNREYWRTLIVDDHPLFRDGLREFLMTLPEFQVCGEADREEQAMQQLLATDADFVTVDISLASGSGLSLISRIKRHKPSAAVLVPASLDDQPGRSVAPGASQSTCANRQPWVLWSCSSGSASHCG